MKKMILYTCFALLSLFTKAQTTPQLVSFDGIGELKLGTEKAELEKILKSKLVFKHIGIDVQYTETFTVQYNGVEMEIDVMGSDQKSVRLDAVLTRSPLFKTAEGIGIGSDQQTIVNTYEKQLLIISKEIITMADADNIHSSIIFLMKDKKVIGIGAQPTAQFRDRE